MGTLPAFHAVADHAVCCQSAADGSAGHQGRFIVCIIDVSQVSSWAFAQIDSIATLVMLAAFALLATTYDHLKVLCILLVLSTAGMGTLAFIAANFEELAIPVHIWLFLQSLCLDIAYLSFRQSFRTLHCMFQDSG